MSKFLKDILCIINHVTIFFVICSQLVRNMSCKVYITQLIWRWVSNLAILLFLFKSRYEVIKIQLRVIRINVTHKFVYSNAKT